MLPNLSFNPLRKWRFEATVKVAGVLRKAGEIVPESEIPPGNLESMRRLNQVSEYVEGDPAAEFAAFMQHGAPAIAAEPAPLPGGFVAAPEDVKPEENKKPEEKKPEDEKPVEAKAKEPKIGPAKPPELKAGGKKN